MPTEYGLPGYVAGRSVTPREISAGGGPLELKPGGIILGSTAIDGGNTGYTYEIRAGWALGRITATGKYVPCKRTTTTSSGAVTSLVVVNSYPFKVGDAIDIGADTNITITDIDYTTHTLTIASTTVASGEAVVGRDGSQTCRGFLAGTRDVYDTETATAVDAQAQLVEGGRLLLSQLLGDITAIMADTTSAAQIRARTIIYDDTNGVNL